VIPVAAATLTFLLLAGAGIVWAVRRDDTHRVSKRRSGADFGESSVIMAYGSGLTEVDDRGVGDSSDCGGGSD
jgi:hypothetical protein